MQQIPSMALHFPFSASSPAAHTGWAGSWAAQPSPTLT